MPFSGTFSKCMIGASPHSAGQAPEVAKCQVMFKSLGAVRKMEAALSGVESILQEISLIDSRLLNKEKSAFWREASPGSIPISRVLRTEW